MKLNNKGMAISGILYSILVLFIVLVFGLLSLLASTKYSFDKFKYDLKEKLESTNFAYANEDYMLLSGAEVGDADQSIFKTLYPEKFEMIKSVNFIMNSSIPENAIEVKDVSKTKSGKVKSYLIEILDEGYDLYVVSNSPIYANYDSSHLFEGLTSAINIDFSNFNTDLVETMKEMFYDCQSLTSLDVSSFNTSNVTNMYAMFSKCQSLTSLDVSNWNTSKVTTMAYMFGGDDAVTPIHMKLTSLDVSNWDTSNVTDMEYMFMSCTQLTSLDVSNWDTGNLIHARGLFYKCWGVTSLDVSNFNTSNVTNMRYMFYNCNKLTSLDVSNFNTSNVTNMEYMFSELSYLTTLDISSFDFTNVTDFDNIFEGTINLENLTLKNSISSNTLDDYLPDRTSLSSGKITLMGGLSGVETSILSTKNWGAYDSAGNGTNGHSGGGSN